MALIVSEVQRKIRKVCSYWKYHRCGRLSELPWIWFEKISWTNKMDKLINCTQFHSIAFPSYILRLVGLQKLTNLTQKSNFSCIGMRNAWSFTPENGKMICAMNQVYTNSNILFPFSSLNIPLLGGFTVRVNTRICCLWISRTSSKWPRFLFVLLLKQDTVPLSYFNTPLPVSLTAYELRFCVSHANFWAICWFINMCIHRLIVFIWPTTYNNTENSA